MRADERVRAWRPGVPQVREVLHARFVEHAYPAHTHGEWTLMLVDTGGVDYTLGRRARRADATGVTLLPPGVPHDGRAVDAVAGFRKRVAYLNADWLGPDAAGRAVNAPTITDIAVLRRTRRLQSALASPGGALAAEGLVLELGAELRAHLGARPLDAGPASDRRLAERLRELLDADLAAPPTLEAAGVVLDAHPASLGRVFTRSVGVSPHRYLTGRRVDRARRLLLEGMPPAEVAAAVGFYDQAHLTRHFRRTLGVTPAAYARGGDPEARADDRAPALSSDARSAASLATGSTPGTARGRSRSRCRSRTSTAAG